MKKKYWILENGLMAITEGQGWGMKNAKEVSKSKYYAEMRERKRMRAEIEDHGFTMRDNVLYFG